MAGGRTVPDPTRTCCGACILFQLSEKISPCSSLLRPIPFVLTLCGAFLFVAVRAVEFKKNK